MELLNWKAEELPELQNHLKKTFTYTSPESQNEIIDLLGSNISAKLISQVNQNNVWSLIADETSDISHQEQFSLCYRTVSPSLVVEEHFFKFVVVPKTDAFTLFESIKQNIFDAGFSVKSLYFQCYDGASNMRGQYSGVASRVREIARKAIYIHCHCHLLNLSLQNFCSTIPCIRNCLGQINSIYNFLEASPKRQVIVVENQNNILPGNERHITIKLLCETRWASRVNAVNSVFDNFEVIIKALEELSQESGKVGGDAETVIKNCCTFEFLFYVSLLKEIFETTSTLSNYLQGSKVTIGAALKSAKSCQRLILSRRNDKFFKVL